jgi:tetratricopeptide (TPR) repeat protein
LLSPCGCCQEKDIHHLWDAAAKARAEGSLAESEKNLRDAVTIAEALPQPELQLAVSLAELGGLMHLEAKNEEASKDFQKAIVIFNAVKGGPPPEVKAGLIADAMGGWAATLMDQGKLDEAAGKVTEAIRLTDNLNSDGSKAQTSSSLITLAQVRLRQENWNACIGAAQKGIDKLHGVGDAEEPDVLRLKALALLALAYSQKGDNAEAQKSADEALKLAERHPEIGGHDLVDAYKAMSMASYNKSDLPQAKMWARRSISLIHKCLGESHPLQAGDLNTLGLIAEREHKFNDAEANFAKALQLLQASNDNPEMIAVIKDNIEKLHSFIKTSNQK